MPKRKRILHVVGARPNFMKLAPVMRALADPELGCEQFLVHTGQHYDERMSRVFFRELDLPEPDVNLEIGSGSHACQTARMMLALDEVLNGRAPEWVFLYGDTNSTLAAALVAAKLDMPIAHVEAGLRSFDRTMPEEVNRILTDNLSNLLFTPSRDGNANLMNEGVSEDKIHLVGNVMIDTLVSNLGKTVNHPILEELNLVCGRGNSTAIRRYVVATLHRPANVDDPIVLKGIIDALGKTSKRVPVIFPIHPRTRKLLNEHSIDVDTGISMIDPQGYLAFLCLVRYAALVVADSGGVQEETTYLGVPCLTVRPNTERPVTITHGTNRLVAPDTPALLAEIECALGLAAHDRVEPPELWDGHASQRIASVMRSIG
mgnify:CR=1 FL=1